MVGAAGLACVAAIELHSWAHFELIQMVRWLGMPGDERDNGIAASTADGQDSKVVNPREEQAWIVVSTQATWAVRQQDLVSVSGFHVARGQDAVCQE